MTHFLVTGGAGFLGSHLVRALLARGDGVRILDDLSTGSRANAPPQVEFIEGDVTDAGAVARALEGVDCCFHLAAIASVERSRYEWVRTHEVNLTGAINVFDKARGDGRRPPIPVVYASSAAIYGDCGPAKADESLPAVPANAYGADKAACELHARVAGVVHGAPTVGLRFFNLYGPRQNADSPYSSVIPIFFRRLMSGEAIEIRGDGEQVRDFTYVGDAVVALLKAQGAASTDAPVFNVCTGVGTSVRQLGEAIATLCDVRLAVRWTAAQPGDLRVSIGDPKRAAAGLGFEVSVPLAEGLRMTRDEMHARTDMLSAQILKSGDGLDASE